MSRVDVHPDQVVFDAFPDALITNDNVDVFRHRLEGRLAVKRCAECRKYHEPPRSFCPHCHSRQLEATPVTGRGVIALFSRVYIGPPSADIDYVAGHPIAVMEIDEQPGVRVAGQFVGPDGRDAILGEPVEVEWLRRGNEPVVAFRPRTAASG